MAASSWNSNGRSMALYCLLSSIFWIPAIQSFGVDTKGRTAVATIVDSASVRQKVDHLISWDGSVGEYPSSVRRVRRFSDKDLPNVPTRTMRRTRLLAANNYSEGRSQDQEVYILSEFRAALTSDSQGVLTNWQNANDSDACNWLGVTCGTQSKKVIALKLDGLNLVGTISPLLGGLVSLQHLDLSNNSFRGIIPASLLDCSNLSYLALTDNKLGGELPSQLGKLVSLQYVDLSYNQLIGVIPISVTNCSLLTYLNLGYNNLTGEIPQMFGHAVLLEYLILDANQLSGSIPTSLGNCSSLAFLQISENDFIVGGIPIELGGLRGLLLISAAYNDLSGTFPAWIANSSALVSLTLSYNHFYGEIPDILGKLQSLQYLYLGGNNFTGFFPTSVTNCSSLTELGLEENYNLVGHIPAELGNLRSLELLYLAFNNFISILPSSLSNCSSLLELTFRPLSPSEAQPQPLPIWFSSFVNLTTLELSYMNLQGELPHGVGMLSKLEWLALRGNNISGILPSTLGNCTALQYLDLSFNQLGGSIPSQFGFLDNLQTLYLQSNNLAGPLTAITANWTSLLFLDVELNLFKEDIGNTILGTLPQLERLSMSDNLLFGKVPDLSNLSSSLFDLELGANQLSGLLPASLGNLTNLQTLVLTENKFQGPIPVDIMGCRSLVDLELDHNQLEGSIPTQIFQLRSLQKLDLSNNRLSGALPGSLGHSESMTRMDLSYNKLDGSLPGEAIANLSLNLISLNISHNIFNALLPQQLVSLTSIQALDLSANMFFGSIPTGFGSFVFLRRLDLSINNLTGSIPQDLGNLGHLQFLNLSYNNLQGPIPEKGFFKNNVTAASFLGDSGLCGSIVQRICSAVGPASPQRRSSSKGFHFSKAIWIPVVCVGAAIGAILTVFGVLRWWRPSYNKIEDDEIKSVGPTFFTPTANGIEMGQLEDICKEENVIGVGSRSKIFRGRLPDGNFFALKVFEFGRPEDQDDPKARGEFLREVTTLASVRHRNIVRILGYCSTSSIEALILEYLSEGSLDKHLHEGGVCELSWETRLEIALGVAEGLVYLHHFSHKPIIHRDLKPSNILLDGDLMPKVGDFGISRFTNPDRNGEVTSSKVCGTTGYMPPEYAMGGRLSVKGDVYSFGVTLLELLTKKRPTDVESFGEAGDLVEYVHQSHPERALELFDPFLADQMVSSSNQEEQMKLLMRVGLLCTQDDPKNRPGTRDVLIMIKQIKGDDTNSVVVREMEELTTFEIQTTPLEREDQTMNDSNF